jgi:Phosphotransferase enzyme family
MPPVEEPLAGSNITAAVRIGHTVRRPRRPSSEAVLTLLRHLRDNGFEECPEPLGFDAQGREVLSYVEGTGGSVPLRAESVTDQALVEHASLIRRFHDAAATFPHAVHRWDPLLADPLGAGEIVCHNDLSIPNTVYRGGLPAALVDWDLAAPGRRLWDLAYAVWWLVPLHRPEFMKAIGWPRVDQGRRLGLFIDAYGLGDDRRFLLEALRERQVRNQEQLRSWADTAMIASYDEDDPAVECGRTEYVQSISARLEAYLGLR